MRILIDATNVAEGGGGIVTYLAGLLRGWSAAQFGDEITVVGSRALPAEIELAEGRRVRVLRIGLPQHASRVLVQQAVLPVVSRQQHPDVILSLTPVVGLVPGPAPVVAVVHDLRYLRQPDDFGRAQRFYRTAAYRQGCRQADALIAVSQTTAEDAARAFAVAPSKLRTIHHGCDHVDSWPAAETHGTHAIAFAHWNNKRPDFAIRVWASLRYRLEGFDRHLHVCGVRSEDAPALATLARVAGVADLVSLHGYLPAQSFERLFSSAALLLMPSTFEGFGLPVLEAMRLGIPVVASRIPAIEEVAGDAAHLADRDSADAFTVECIRLLADESLRRETIERGRAHASGYTWERAAIQTRELLAAVRWRAA